MWDRSKDDYRETNEERHQEIERHIEDKLRDSIDKEKRNRAGEGRKETERERERDKEWMCKSITPLTELTW